MLIDFTTQLLIFADATEQPASILPLLASGVLGGAIFVLALRVATVLRTEDLQQGDEWRYDVSRINELRRTDLLYRWFFPLIAPLAILNRRAFAEQLPQIQREIQAAGLTRFWLAEEYLARCEVLVLLIAPAMFYMGFRMFALPGVIFALGAIVFMAWLLRRRLAKQAQLRLRRIKTRMPFLLDLLTLLMEAGSNFLRALEQGVQEFGDHPVAVEFKRVITDMNLGKTRTEAFQAMQYRLADDEITSIIGSIIQGESLGTPLASVFRTQSEVLRLKRSQSAEKLAAEAGVNMLLPGILIMLSTVLIIIGPFALSYLYSGLLL